MANSVYIVFLDAAAMERHRLPRRFGMRPDLLPWVADRLARQDEPAVAAYVLRELPGMAPVVSFRGESGFMRCVHKLTSRAPNPLRQRMNANYPEIDVLVEGFDALVAAIFADDRRRRRQFLDSWDSPLRVLDMTGWQFLLPADLAYLEQAYAELAPGSSDLSGYAVEWAKLFAAHRSSPYDAAAVIGESLAIL